MSYYCNPLNIEYKYQFNKTPDGGIAVSREAADPTIIAFKGQYYIFASMACGFWHSTDLTDWMFHPLNNAPNYDYAPDVSVVGDYIVLCASSQEYGRFYRTKDLFLDEFEIIECPFPFWDPNLFLDDNGRLYLYWGCGAGTPINGIELNPGTLLPIGDKVELIWGNDKEKGFERNGENYEAAKRNTKEMEAKLAELEKSNPEMAAKIRKTALEYMSGQPYIEGAYMTKHSGRYYLQYAAPGTQYNTYADGVYIGDSPLGTFTLAKNNPFSYKPGGFIPGAGHGSTMADLGGDYWHMSTMRISVNHIFERRIGLWPAGFDKDGELFCNQRYGDWVYDINKLKADPFAMPEWMLLSYGKPARASSFASGKEPKNATDENVQTWWRANTGKRGEWLEVDLGKVCDVRSVQINFADDSPKVTLPENVKFQGSEFSQRWIDEVHQATQWKLDGSVDGKAYFTIEDKSEVDTDLSHDLVIMEQGIYARYIRLTVISLPYGQAACVSGIRIFGIGNGELPKMSNNICTELSSDLDLIVSWGNDDATGHNVLWGTAPDKLYHSCIVFGKKEQKIGALIKGEPLYVRIDMFNESGITEGKIITVREKKAC
jgi:hypothetical protein